MTCDQGSCSRDGPSSALESSTCALFIPALLILIFGVSDAIFLQLPLSR